MILIHTYRVRAFRVIDSRVIITRCKWHQTLLLLFLSKYVGSPQPAYPLVQVAPEPLDIKMDRCLIETAFVLPKNLVHGVLFNVITGQIVTGIVRTAVLVD